MKKVNVSHLKDLDWGLPPHVAESKREYHVSEA